MAKEHGGSMTVLSYDQVSPFKSQVEHVVLWVC